MVQTIVVILLILAGGVLLETNMNVLGAPVTLAIPNSASVTATIAQIVLAALAAFVVIWLAGQLDRAVLTWQFRRRAEVRPDMRTEMVQSTPADPREPNVMYVSLTNIHKRLDTIEQQLDTVRQQLDAAMARRVPVGGPGP